MSPSKDTRRDIAQNPRRPVEQQQASDVTLGNTANLLKDRADKGISGKVANHHKARGQHRYPHATIL